MSETFQNGDRIKTHERIATLEADVKTIMTNHLPHMAEDIKTVGNRVWAVLLTVIVSTLIGIGMAIWFK